jgi:gluconolactonase
MNKIFFAAAFIAIACCSCNAKNEEDKTPPTVITYNTGKVEIYDATAASIIDSNASIEIISKNFNWSEGPLWIASKKMLLFSDVPENKIFQWKNGDTAKLYLMPSGYTDTAIRNGENGANGLALDKDERLLLCQSGNRCVARLNTSLDSPKAAFTVLSANYNGKKFNSPNDLVEDSKRNIFFTDPIYGLPKYENDPSRELTFEGVFKIDAAGKTTLLIDSIPRPNGVALSPDEKILYVASSDNIKPRWYAYQLDDNRNIASGGVLLDAVPLKEKATVKQGPDGMKVDKNGNIFGAGPDGINIISPQGKRLGLIKIYNRPVSNCAFNENKNVLYVTADDVIIKVTLHP